MVFMRQYNGGGAGRKVRALSEVSVEFGLHHKAVWCWLNSWCPRWKIGLKRVPDSKGCCRQWMRSVQFSSVTQLCLTLCEPMDYSTPGFHVFHCLLGVHSNSCPLSEWCHPTITSSVTLFSSCLQSFPASGSFSVSWLFASCGQSTGASASASVLPMNIQGWFSLG